MEIRDIRKKHWFWLDNALLDRYGAQLGPYGLAVYMCLARMANGDTQTAFPSLRRIADLTGMSIRKVRDCLRQLQELNLLGVSARTTQQGDCDTNEYLLLDLPQPVADFSVPQEPQEGTACGAPPPACGAGGVRHVVPEGTACGAAPPIILKEQDLKEQDSVIDSVAVEWLQSLNTLTGSKFKSVEGNLRPIRARIREGYTLAEAESVIRAKVKQWQGTENEEYLRPSTLFGPKFDSYLNGKRAPANGFSRATLNDSFAGVSTGEVKL